LAALAAVGAASAQSSVTISGKFGVAVQQGLGAEGGYKGKSNIAVTDGDVNFAAVEDLGGGLRAGATIGLRTRGRENTSVATTQAVTTTPSLTTAQAYSRSSYSEVGRDATVFLSGGFGRLTLGSIELGNGITGNGWGGTNLSLPTDVNNGGVLSANSYANIAQYTSPTFNGLTVTVTRADSAATVGVSPKTIAASGNETDRGVTANVVGLSYVAGPISASIDSTNFGGNTSFTGAASNRKRTRVSASYDFGVARVGAGQEDNKGTASTGNYNGKQTTFGVSAPVSPALRVGMIYAKNTESAVLGVAAGANVVAKATGIAADYSLSKRTVINVSTAKIERADLADSSSYDKEGRQFRVRLMHNF
jgi:predicted porin